MEAEDEIAEEPALDELAATPASEEADVEVEREQDAPEPTSSIPRRARGATRRCATCASSATRCCARARCRSSASTRRCEREIERMGELMHDALGVGLAATQLGVLHRVLVYRAYPEDPLTALVNPVLEWRERGAARRPKRAASACPACTSRSSARRACACARRTSAARQLEIEAEGLTARVIQHEIDHLDGVLILDRISREARKEAMRAMREAQETAERRLAAPRAP